MIFGLKPQQTYTVVILPLISFKTNVCDKVKKRTN
jgi:hypothetical protein